MITLNNNLFILKFNQILKKHLSKIIETINHLKIVFKRSNIRSKKIEENNKKNKEDYEKILNYYRTFQMKLKLNSKNTWEYYLKFQTFKKYEMKIFNQKILELKINNSKLRNWLEIIEQYNSRLLKDKRTKIYKSLFFSQDIYSLFISKKLKLKFLKKNEIQNKFSFKLDWMVFRRNKTLNFSLNPDFGTSILNSHVEDKNGSYKAMNLELSHELYLKKIYLKKLALEKYNFSVTKFLSLKIYNSLNNIELIALPIMFKLLTIIDPFEYTFLESINYDILNKELFNIFEDIGNSNDASIP